ncbi:MAG: outer membrane beta-barrel protein [Candidatus Paceibacterota bacterium]
MRRIFRYLFPTLLLAAVTLTSAQAQDGVIRFNSGSNLPSSPDGFSDYWHSGVALGAGGVATITQNFGVVAGLDYNRFGLSGEKFVEDFGLDAFGVSVSGGSVNVLNMSGGLKATLSPSNSVSPYVISDIGAFLMIVSDIKVEDGRRQSVEEIDESQTRFGASLGAGLDLKMTPSHGVFVEARYSRIFRSGDDLSFFPLRVGIFVSR